MTTTAAALKHTAAGQYLGYSLQQVRLLYRLLTAPPGALVSLEFLDDVAVHAADGTTILEQCKSALSHNPLSDWSLDLWKTVSNWLDIVEGGSIDPRRTDFIIYVTPTKVGLWAGLLNDADTASKVDELVSQIEAALAKKRKAPECAAYIRRFLDTDKATRDAIVENTRIVSDDNDPLEPVRKLLDLTVSPAALDVICRAAIGLAKEQLDKLIRAGEDPILAVDAFRTEFRAFVQRNNLPGFLASIAPRPPSSEVEALFASRPVFVRQLELVGVERDQQMRAVSDYLRASADRAIWAESGLIYSQGLNEWNDDLVTRYSAISNEISEIHDRKAPPTRGLMVYWRCASLDAPMDGRAVPLHFVHGSFNSLAHVCRIGWHPDYALLLG